MRYTLLGLLLLTSGCAPGVFYLGVSIDNDGDGVLPTEGDCDDWDPTVALGLDEICDGLDNDCDGMVDGEDDELRDDDSDGADDCEDCDDGDPSRSPGSEEVCDGLDNDCDSELPDDESDLDGDGVPACGGDCDDSNPSVFPGAAEVCDGLNNDCDETVDEPSPESLFSQIGVAGPGGDVRSWGLSGGVLTAPSELTIPVPSGFVGALLALDVDGDGSAEWLRQQVDPMDSDADEVLSLSRECGGGWSVPLIQNISLGGESRIVAGGDLDGDGFGDVVTVVLAGLNAGDAVVQLGDGSGGYLVRPSDVSIPAVASGGRWAVTPRLKDLNGDGALDLLVCADEPPLASCRLYGGQGDGSFAGGVVRAELPVTFGSIDVGDGNGDGVLDLFAGLRGPDDGGVVYMLKGDGAGRFGDAIEIVNLGVNDGGDGVLAVIPGVSGVGLALIWEPGFGSDVRELVVARSDGDSWSLGPSEVFSSVLAAAGRSEILVVSP